MSVNWANTSVTPSLSSMWPAAGSTLAPATLELTPGPTGLTYISHKAARRQPKVGTDQATNALQCSSVSVKRVNVHIVDAVNSIVWQKLLRVLNLRKTIYLFTVSSLDKTSDISKLEQFHISDIYLDCKGAKVLHIAAWMQIRCAQSQGCICLISLSYTLKWIWKPCLCHGLI